jgi:hypothetical protein
VRTETWVKKRGVRNEVKYVDTETWVHKSDTETQVQNRVHRNADAELWVQEKEFKNVGRETWEKTGSRKMGTEKWLQKRGYSQRMRCSLVVRASECQCTSCNGLGFDPSIRRHSGI